MSVPPRATDLGSLQLLELSPGEGFGDRSSCTVRDELTFEPRFAGLLVYRIVRAFFSHRHRMLARHHGWRDPA
ncbi:MAG: hypothetical protein KF718_00460 [Polyangiaceae bacterium]|nr:hypothetical protein [Polyangiaceae bacterium]